MNNSNKIRILHIVYSLEIGGLEQFVVKLIKNYNKTVDSKIVCLYKSGEVGNKLYDTKIFELDKKPGIQIKLIFKIIKIILKEKSQIVHTHNSGPNFYGGIAGFLCKVPVINTKHGREDTRNNNFLNRTAAIFSKKIITVSNDSAMVCKKQDRINSKKILTIWNGIDINEFKPKNYNEILKKEIEPNKNILNIGIVARLSAEKDHITFLRAIKILKTTHTNFGVLIIGDGPLKNNLKNEVYKLGIDNCVKFLGNRSDIPELMKKLDIFVLSSITEGIPLSLLEAQASGIPVVATNVGGNSEIVADGLSGFIVEPQKPQLMAEKIAALLSDYKLRKKLGEKGRTNIEENFNLENTARKYIEIYKEFVS